MSDLFVSKLHFFSLHISASYDGEVVIRKSLFFGTSGYVVSGDACSSRPLPLIPYSSSSCSNPPLTLYCYADAVADQAKAESKEPDPGAPVEIGRGFNLDANESHALHHLCNACKAPMQAVLSLLVSFLLLGFLSLYLLGLRANPATDTPRTKAIATALGFSGFSLGVNLSRRVLECYAKSPTDVFALPDNSVEATKGHGLSSLGFSIFVYFAICVISTACPTTPKLERDKLVEEAARLVRTSRFKIVPKPKSPFVPPSLPLISKYTPQQAAPQDQRKGLREVANSRQTGRETTGMKAEEIKKKRMTTRMSAIGTKRRGGSDNDSEGKDDDDDDDDNDKGEENEEDEIKPYELTAVQRLDLDDA